MKKSNFLYRHQHLPAYIFFEGNSFPQDLEGPDDRLMAVMNVQEKKLDHTWLYIEEGGGIGEWFQINKKWIIIIGLGLIVIWAFMSRVGQ